MSDSQTNKKVYVAMSGGVDSSVAAALLLEQGYEVTGVYMKNWSGEDFGVKLNCPWEEDMEILDKVCSTLGIKYISYNFEKEYKEQVIKYFFSEYSSGRTPNPDVMCNSQIKFGTYLNRALEEGADMIATGHYVRRIKNKEERIKDPNILGESFRLDRNQTSHDVQESDSEQALSLARADGITENSQLQSTLALRLAGTTNYSLLKGVDSNKDQSYFLHTLNQFQLSKSLFPVGGFTKPKIRKMAERFGLPNASRKDSQGICFIGKVNVGDFLRANITVRPGLIVDIDSTENVGEHDGVYYYTIGQREGLGIGGSDKPYYVVGKDVESNILYVAKGEENPALFKSEIYLEDMHWIGGESILPLDCEVSVRYRQKPQKAKLEFTENFFKVTFNLPMRGVSPGQSAVVYIGDVCLGGEVIKG